MQPYEIYIQHEYARKNARNDANNAYYNPVEYASVRVHVNNSTRTTPQYLPDIIEKRHHCELRTLN